jgi:hypothetical protein
MKKYEKKRKKNFISKKEKKVLKKNIYSYALACFTKLYTIL